MNPASKVKNLRDMGSLVAEREQLIITTKGEPYLNSVYASQGLSRGGRFNIPDSCNKIALLQFECGRIAGESATKSGTTPAPVKTGTTTTAPAPAPALAPVASSSPLGVGRASLGQYRAFNADDLTKFLRQGGCVSRADFEKMNGAEKSYHCSNGGKVRDEAAK